MSGQVINSNPYEFSASGIDYRELLAVNKTLDEIRSRSSELADELSQKPVSSAYLRQVLENMSPPAPKVSFALPPKEPMAGERIRTLEELIVINFNKRQTNEVCATFTVYDSNKSKSVDIGMTTLRVLESVFQTPGRTIPEMEAISYLQGVFLRSIPAIRYKRELLAFLHDLPRENAIVSGIVDKLTALCEAV